MNEAPGKNRARTDSEKQETLMNERHYPHWPPQVPLHLTLPETNLFYNAEVSAARYPDKPFIIFYDTTITFAGFKDEAERIAGFLQQECGSRPATACCCTCRTVRNGSSLTTASCGRTRWWCRSIR